MICWYCHWGWPAQVIAIYDRGMDSVGESAMHYGPAHIVWEDENFEQDHVESCLQHIEDKSWTNDLTPAEIAGVKQSLEELLALPKHIREAQPEEYDWEHPEKYPPALDLLMVHR